MGKKTSAWPFVGGGVLVMVFFSWVVYINIPRAHYIVSDKKQGKIVYRDMANSTNLHAMQFDTIKNPNFYPYINIGDTITGFGSVLDKPAVNASTLVHDKYGSRHVAGIQYLNGKDLPAVQALARRDSLINEINIRHR